jgi:hypothetical protein
MLMNKNKTTAYKTSYGVWRIVYICIFAILISGIGLTYYFIYQNIYTTIADSSTIVALKSSVNIYNLDLAAFERAAAAIEKKSKLEYFSPDIRNVFYYQLTTSSTYASTSSKQ